MAIGLGPCGHDGLVSGNAADSDLLILEENGRQTLFRSVVFPGEGLLCAIWFTSMYEKLFGGMETEGDCLDCGGSRRLIRRW